MRSAGTNAGRRRNHPPSGTPRAKGTAGTAPPLVATKVAAGARGLRGCRGRRESEPAENAAQFSPLRNGRGAAPRGRAGGVCAHAESGNDQDGRPGTGGSQGRHRRKVSGLDPDESSQCPGRLGAWEMRGGCARVQGAEFVLRCACRRSRACIRLGDTPQGWREAHGMCEGYLTDGNPE